MATATAAAAGDNMHGTYCHFSWHANQANSRGHALSAPSVFLTCEATPSSNSPHLGGTPAELGEKFYLLKLKQSSARRSATEAEAGAGAGAEAEASLSSW